MGGPVTRYVTARLLCSCSHSLQLHNIETKARACSSCDCGSYSQAAVEWTDRTVTVEQDVAS